MSECWVAERKYGATVATEGTCDTLRSMLDEGGCSPTIDYDEQRLTIEGCDQGWPAAITFCPFCGGELKVRPEGEDE